MVNVQGQHVYLRFVSMWMRSLLCTVGAGGFLRTRDCKETAEGKTEREREGERVNTRKGGRSDGQESNTHTERARHTHPER
jgi:hypothetical protein